MDELRYQTDLIEKTGLLDSTSGKGSFQSALGKSDVHVWSFHLATSRSSLARFQSFLSSNERERARRFHFEQHRNHYIAGRGWLRELLGHYLDISPEQLEFEYGRYGKPILSDRCNNALHFNLAHSDGMALAGITRVGVLGLDIERIQVLEDMSELVKLFFSARENSIFQKLELEQRLFAFFNLWTRKEAFLKATGEGISQYLNQVEVTFLPGERARFLKVPKRFESAEKWTLKDLTVGPGFKAAVAVSVRDIRIYYHEWCEENR
jgi:4'-phosphopantetheinyl transferase